MKWECPLGSLEVERTRIMNQMGMKELPEGFPEIVDLTTYLLMTNEEKLEYRTSIQARILVANQVRYNAEKKKHDQARRLGKILFKLFCTWAGYVALFAVISDGTGLGHMFAVAVITAFIVGVWS